MTNNEINRLPRPFPNAVGNWINRESCIREKSFGYFYCSGCDMRWQSAHSFKSYSQQCKNCETANYPRYMWEQESKNYSISKKTLTDNKKPHDKFRCGACRAGKCDVLSSI